ncbi:inositol monophosphatase family protein [Octadecabacter sp. 1_MG-2023]|uniref:inositol monophosphatase family protein n=1 Tax=unclassified Octadecabacter TaxID=196158 RepID=UPI001C07EF9F|nr:MULTISPECIES: inositol monophosphatase family protein [unclassified Octadecabacter]MBU2992722.1 inositol monophosphatase family protein [Octadecabacter sp. B2R22]MDO6733827.1 inositol monophosphatase family protein [Octadecabacter sp. 1_MG-2023]
MTLKQITLNTDDQAALRACAHALADAARAVILPLFRTGIASDNKEAGGFDPVTEADRAAELAMRDVLARLRPDDGILGEEYGTKDGTSGLQWVLDPIDGTRGFISGTPTWGVLISVRDASGPIYGIIDQPYIGERFEGGFGIGEVVGPLGTASFATKTTTDLADATILTTFPEVGSEAEGAAFRSVAAQCKLTRYGMDCYAYALIAAGQIDLVVEASLSAYDIQAPIAVIQAAGGVVTDWQGGPAHEGGQVLAAANADIHARALEILSKASMT